MSDTGALNVGETKHLEASGRNLFADEAVTEDSGGRIITVAAATDGSGATDVTGVAAGTATITVQPGTEDTGFSAGSIDVTVSVPLTPLPLSLV